MPDHVRHVSPRLCGVERLTAEEAHYLGNCAYRRVLLEVILREHSEDETFGFDSGGIVSNCGYSVLACSAIRCDTGSGAA